MDQVFNMRITTKAIYEWDKDTKQYVEVYAEDYEYNGDLSLAQGEGEGSSGSWVGEGKYESPEWHPSYQTMMDYFDEGMTLGDVAIGFGMKREDEDLLPPLDYWKSGYAEDVYDVRVKEEKAAGFGGISVPDDPDTEFNESTMTTMGTAGLAQETYKLQQEKTKRDITESWEKYAMGMGGALTSADASMYDIMEQSRTREAQSGFTGAGKRSQGRAMRQAEETFTQGITGIHADTRSAEAIAIETEDTASLGFKSALADYVDSQRTMELAEITKDKAIETDKR